MNALTSTLSVIERAMRALAACCLACMALITVIDVTGRAFGHPLFGSEEITAFLAALAVAMSLPYAHSQRSHIAVELFYVRLGRTARTAASLLTGTLSLAAFGVLSWRMARFALTTRESGEVSMNLGLPEWMVMGAVALGCAVFTLMILRDILRLVTGVEQA
ncbi:TRAP transporter small permease [Salidesulfovibrio brasiliensis]|uniref:TRAP transporter small permease n=1 Tax=Salidesulfovibrio brasiliensis TaxID=221711 RepID=UPI0006D1025B|nr:TRAP transporter small permease [Salidesulfovibrio brasiliensis]